MNNNATTFVCAAVHIAAAFVLGVYPQPAIAMELLHRQGVLVLQSGQVIEGEISLTNGVYTVKVVENGELRFRRKAVRLHRQTMDQAYLAMRDELPPGDAAARLKLAGWCLKNDLPARAADQLLAISIEDPGNAQAGYLERRLQSRELAPPPVVVSQLPPATADNPETAAQDLTASQLTEFSTTIQPVLLNTCATSTCHGGRGKTTLVLIRPSAAGLLGARHTRRNLARIRPYLQFEGGGTKLLSAARTPHAAASAPLNSESPQFKALQQWVNSLAWIQEAQSSGQLSASPAAEPGALPPGADAPGAATKIIHGDPTSPEAFNQQFHTTPAGAGN